ncbi:MAG: DNA primase [Candidatus Pacebacteria bacterium]|nr:DNA primase [Candidatus Paceibacterota bacterium]
MSRDAVEQIKTRINIVDVVESYIKLQKAGKNYKARSPFTNERTPSFFVSPDQGLYYCFSSGKGGDMFTFIQEMEGVDFVGALKVLADRAGVELKKESAAVRNERDAILTALEVATRFYEAQLPKQEKVIAYLKKRGMTGKTAKQFRVGYALEEWNTLYDHLLAKGFSTQVMEKAGLVVKGDKGYYDRFRGRIMFPIANSSGKIVAFSGRVFHISEKPEDKTAKYVNSPETEIYNKSEILYGFDKAKQAIRKGNICVFVEGQMDLVMSHQVGVENVVAVSGTALSERHLNLIHRTADNLIFAFDADDAGVNAAERGIGLALAEGFEVKIVNMSKGKDPADIILENSNKWIKLIADAEPIIDFYLDHVIRENKDDRTKLKGVREIILPFVKCLNRSMEQGRYVSKIADKIQVAEQSVWDDLEKVPARIQQKEFQQKEVEWKDIFSRKKKIEEKMLGIILWQEGLEKKEIDIEAVKKRYVEAGGDKTKIEEDVPKEEKGRLIFEAEIYCNQETTAQKIVEDMITNLQRETLKEEAVELKKGLSQAGMSEEQEKELLKKIQDKQKQIDLLDNNKK